ncbi:TIGR04255 family protein [Sinorhizobium sp. 7-81]|uniref:TIGR04255 family protein n=1 Tax=Sinorhizobium sp. 8-89 TaxID=3049089 RepID=UPI0024C43477|nr:TIGR04255 family protein [Sinorhizobium sp. 8-89]MDK1494074.1 TIGR04255 family protein [Sinorhizobium sp. 8-89]
MTYNVVDPLFSEELPEIPLANAPLARVLAQVRFPEIQSVQDKSFVAPFQERIRKLYPRTMTDTLNGFLVGSPHLVSTNIWRYLDADGWRVSLSDSFMSLETTKYTSRKDFTSRFLFLLQQLAETVGPTHTNRIGIRYVDQVLLDESESMSGMLRKEMIGVKDIFGKTHHMISELEGASKEGGVLVRWGHMPAMASHDPDIMIPIDKPSWFLDVDSYKIHESETVAFNPEEVADLTYSLATRAYTIFRWSVTDQFLDRYGRIAQ